MSDHSITSLIEKLEGAEVGSRELGNLILAATNPYKSGPYAHWHTAAMAFDWSNEVTTSLDAALALAERVVSDWRVAHLGMAREADDHGAYIGGWSVRLHCMTKGILHNLVYGEAATPALALCAAVLRAQSEAS